MRTKCFFLLHQTELLLVLHQKTDDFQILKFNSCSIELKSGQSKPEILILLDYLIKVQYSQNSTLDLQLRCYCCVEILRSESKIKFVDGSI